MPNWKDDHDAWKAMRDGTTRFRGTHNECFAFILNNQGQSVEWACKHEGWSIEPECQVCTGTATEPTARCKRCHDEYMANPHDSGWPEAEYVENGSD